MTKIEFPQIVVRSGWYNVCPGDCYCGSLPIPGDRPQGAQSWNVEVLYQGAKVATLRYRDTWCPLYMDYAVLTGMPIDDEGVEVRLKFDADMSGAYGGPQVLFPAFAQLFWDKNDKKWKMLVPSEYSVSCEKAQPPCCLPRKDVRWKVDEVTLSDYGMIEIVKSEPTEVALNIKFTEPEEDKLTCSCENFYMTFPWGCPALVSCESASFSKHPDWVSWTYFGAFTNLSTKSCWNSQIYKVNVRTGEGTVDTVSNQLKVSGEPLIPKQCLPWIPIGVGAALGIGFILSRLGGE